ncbi:protein MOR1, partial [Tanacetum coccineum]
LISEITAAAAVVLSVAATAAFVRRKVVVSAAVSPEPLQSLLIGIFGVAPCGGFQEVTTKEIDDVETYCNSSKGLKVMVVGVGAFVFANSFVLGQAGAISILYTLVQINNAGLSQNVGSYNFVETFENFIKTNYYGTGFGLWPVLPGDGGVTNYYGTKNVTKAIVSSMEMEFAHTLRQIKVKIKICQASYGGFVRKSVASMLGGKKPVTTAPASKKAGPVKTSAGKKATGPSQNKQVALEDVEPAEMTLEEIVSRFGSLILEDTVTPIISFKENVIALQELDQSVEIIIRLLCTVPGWNEKNVQVQQQVTEVISHIASTTTKFLKICVVLCIGGICQRVADIKTRAQAMKCLITFSKAMGPCFVKNVQDNERAQESKSSYVVAAINATIKLIGALHKFVGPNIKAFLSDVFHNLLPTDIYSLVVDALEPSVKDELLKNFCDEELISYHQIFEGAVFGIPSELAKLDKTEMRYAWVKRHLSTNEEIWKIFPTSWHVDYLLCIQLCKLTSDCISF